MKFQFEQALDACLAQLNTGADLEVVLSDFPECADELRPALAASEWMQRLAPPPERKHVSKDVFVAAVAERRRLVERVDGLVVEVKVGVPVSELLARTAAPLQGVVCAAHAMHADVLPMPAPETVARGKAEFMARVAQRRAAAHGSASTRVASTRVAAPQTGNGSGAWRGVFGTLLSKPTFARRAVSSAVALTLASAIGVTGVAQVSRAAASSLPGEALYQVKVIGQNARMLFQFDPAARSALQSKFAQGRLSEIEALIAAGRPVPTDAVAAVLADPTSPDDLTTAQRAMLGDLAESIARTDRALAERLRAFVGEPTDSARRGVGDADAIPNRKPIEVQLPDDEFAPVPVPVQVDVRRAPELAPPSAEKPSSDQGAPPVSEPPVRRMVDDQTTGDTSGGGDAASSTGGSGPADPGSAGGGEPLPDEPEPSVPPHMQPNAGPAPEVPSTAP